MFAQGNVKTGFILSIVSGALITIQGALHIIRTQWALELGLGELRRHSLRGIDIKVLGIVTLILGVMVLVGAFLIRSGRVREGGITVISFSVLTIFAGGGYFVGVILGVIGGALALGYHLPQKHEPEPKQN
jgi:hypothetical protein